MQLAEFATLTNKNVYSLFLAITARVGQTGKKLEKIVQKNSTQKPVKNL